MDAVVNFGDLALKRRTAFLYLLACLLHLPDAAAAPCGPYKVALYDHGALYSMQADGQWAGIDKDLIAELGRRTGCKFDIVLESRVRIWTMLEAGTLDMTVSGIENPERAQFARFVPYLATRNSVLLHREVPPAVVSLEAFEANPHYKVAAIKSFKHGPTYDAWLERLRAQGRVYDTADFTSLLRLLKIGRVHAVIALPTSWAPRRAELQSASVRVMEWAPKEAVIGGLVLSRKRIPAATAELFGKTIQAMRQDGSLEAIYTRHVGAQLAPTLLP